MMTPSLPGYKVECVGDDIAWMRFDEEGQLRAINPEAGFFGVAPGTSRSTNPQAMQTIMSNTLFTNVAKTSDGGVYWEDIDDDAVSPGATITSWLGEENWQPGDKKNPAAHPNSRHVFVHYFSSKNSSTVNPFKLKHQSNNTHIIYVLSCFLIGGYSTHRFCTPAAQCPIIDPRWEDTKGVKIDAIIFGGRRPQGVPLVYESRNWQHGVFVGASMRSESTAAAEHKGSTCYCLPSIIFAVLRVITAFF